MYTYKCTKTKQNVRDLLLKTNISHAVLLTHHSSAQIRCYTLAWIENLVKTKLQLKGGAAIAKTQLQPKLTSICPMAGVNSNLVHKIPSTCVPFWSPSNIFRQIEEFRDHRRYKLAGLCVASGLMLCCFRGIHGIFTALLVLFVWLACICCLFSQMVFGCNCVMTPALLW